MNCPKCGAPAKPEAAFCSVCGAMLDFQQAAGMTPQQQYPGAPDAAGPADGRPLQTWPAQPAPPPGQASPPPGGPPPVGAPWPGPSGDVPVQTWPAQPEDTSAAPPAPVGYPPSPGQPGYPAGPPPGYPGGPPPAGWQQQGYPGYPQQAPPKSPLTAVLVVSLIVFLLGAAGIVGYVLWSDDSDSGDEVSPTLSTSVPFPTSGPPASADPQGSDTTMGEAGYATPEEALQSVLPEGWTYRRIIEGRDEVTYWGGPAQSEWATVYVVSKAGGGGWILSDSRPYGSPSDAVPGDTDAEVEQVATVVDSFLRAVMEDRPDDAHALTVEPFASDGASAAYSNGDFLSYSLDSWERMTDGTYWIYTTEEWRDSTDAWAYHVVPTEEGWRISELTIAE